jgi:tRNA (cmo5U34)-methyltransferase
LTQEVLDGLTEEAQYPSKAPSIVRRVSEEWSDPSRVSEYLSREIPHRETAEAMLLEALPERVERFLDLGTGDGRLAALIRSRHSQSRGVALDVSRPMLVRAAERFDGDPAVELVAGDLNWRIGVSGPFDAVVSGLAIHHLEDARKRSLFGEIHTLLAPGGVFANLDLVASATARQHERFRRAIGREQDDPSDRLAGLSEQLEWLWEQGFVEVDCHFKWLELALMVARRG